MTVLQMYFYEKVPIDSYGANFTKSRPLYKAILTVYHAEQSTSLSFISNRACRFLRSNQCITNKLSGAKPISAITSVQALVSAKGRVPNATRPFNINLLAVLRIEDYLAQLLCVNYFI